MKHKRSRHPSGIRFIVTELAWCGLLVPREETRFCWRDVDCKNCRRHKPKGKK